MSVRTNEWAVGEWTFYEIEGHSFPDYQGKPLYGYQPTGASTLYPSLEWAMAEAIAEKHLGTPGAGGTAVGSAAAWFMQMIGVSQLKPAGAKGVTALMAAMELSNGFPPVGEREWAARIAESLLRRGYVIAKDPGA